MVASARWAHHHLLYLGLHHIVWHVPGTLHFDRSLDTLQHLMDRRTYRLLPTIRPSLVGRRIGHWPFQTCLTHGHRVVACWHLYDKHLQRVLAICTCAGVLHWACKWLYVCPYGLRYLDLLRCDEAKFCDQYHIMWIGNRGFGNPDNAQ